MFAVGLSSQLAVSPMPLFQAPPSGLRHSARLVCEFGCCCDENPNIFELLALLNNEFEFEPISEFIGIFELLELEVDNKESNADKSGLIC